MLDFYFYFFFFPGSIKRVVRVGWGRGRGEETKLRFECRSFVHSPFKLYSSGFQSTIAGSTVEFLIEESGERAKILHD